MSAADRGDVDVYVVGLGIKAVEHVTREAEAAMRRCRRIFFVDPGFGVDEYLRSLCPDVTSLMGHYREGGERRPTYAAMAADVIDAALDETPVCFATYGHPLVYVHPTRLIQRAGGLLGLNVRVLPGISALDTLMIDVGFDPGPHGLQMYEATDLLARERPLQPDVPCVIWQISSLESAAYSTKRATAERFERLERYLLRTYPPGHVATMVLSSTYTLLPPTLEPLAVGELAERLATGLQAGSLYIPPVAERPVTNHEFVRDVYDPEHLARTSEDDYPP